MLRVGITGGIGSGKSMVSRCFGLLGVPVFSADDSAKKLMNESSSLRQSLIKHFGPEVYSAGNLLNRSWLAEKVFNDEQKLAELNSFVHPAVADDYIEWTKKYPDARYTLRESAILFESGSWKDLDFIILVDAAEDLRIRRIKARDNRSYEAIKSIIMRQWQSEKKRTLANTIIENDDQHLVLPQVIRLHSEFLNYGS